MIKPLSFRVWDFKSIRDSGECSFSADGITVLAGQNESGKTAVLSALRDFDLAVGSKPATPDYLPEDRFDAEPRVSVFFAVDEHDLKEGLAEDKRTVPPGFFEELKKDGGLRVTRKLLSGNYILDPKFDQIWPDPDGTATSEQQSPDLAQLVEENGDEAKSDGGESIGSGPAPFSNPADFAAYLRDYWPVFVYFDSFQDLIPRSVDLEALVPAKASQSSTPPSQASATKQQTSKKIPQSVHDFITQSGMDLGRIGTFVGQEKTLSNYLTSCSAKITGDFLHYWKQRVPGSETVQLQVRHQRDEDGNSQLAFYVHDKFDQYPEQRSKGFVWFLSFYLRLAAAYTRESREQQTRVLLIDEPGTYRSEMSAVWKHRPPPNVVHAFQPLVPPFSLAYAVATQNSLMGVFRSSSLPSCSMCKGHQEAIAAGPLAVVAKAGLSSGLTTPR